MKQRPTVPEMIRKVHAEWLQKDPEATGKWINSGSCEDFANEVVDNLVELGALNVFTLESTDFVNGSHDVWHVWIYCNGMHFDAECPDGEPDWECLPFFTRWWPNGAKRKFTLEDERRMLHVTAQMWIKTRLAIARETKK